MSLEKNNPHIPLCAPEIQENEWKYVKECLETGWVSSVGPFVNRFEKEVASIVGIKYAVATVSGTAALHIALLVAGVQFDDEVLITSLTFIAPANAIRYVGAWPVFIDIEPNYWQMDANKLEDFVNNECRSLNGKLHNKATGRRIKAIVPVHILGHPVDMDPILDIARKYDLVVIEDATESLGATYKGRNVGNLGDVACLSFNGNKIITAGGGGMIATDNASWAEKAKHLTTQANDDPVEYCHSEIGYNYRLSNIHAAVGCAQLERLNDYVLAKRRIATKYSEGLRDIEGISVMKEAEWACSVYWMYTVLVDEGRYGMSSRELMRILLQNGIEARPVWQPLHRSKAHEGAQSCGGCVADKVSRCALSLPSSVGLSKEDLNRVIDIMCLSGCVRFQQLRRFGVT